MTMRSDCRICGGRKLDLILQLAPTPIGDDFLKTPHPQELHPIDLYQCADCGLAQLLYEIPPEEIYRNYLYLTSSSVGLDEHFRRYAEDVVSTCKLKPGDLVVDIGSNDGTLLQHFRALGMQVFGFEASPAIAKASRERGIPTLSEYFSEESLRHWIGPKPAVITANNVLANVNDLHGFMRAVARLLRSDGTFVMESFYLGDIVHNMAFDFIYHEHLSAFSVKPLKRLLQRFDLQMVKSLHVPTKGGSIRHYCQRYFATKGDAVPDDDSKLYDLETYRAWRGKIEETRLLTRRFLDQAKEQGARIAGFGASISCTTLMYHFGLGDYIEYLVDDNPAKHGRFSPGLHLPVYPVEALYKRGADYVVCLAWRFAEDFRNAHPGFSTVTPLPAFSWQVADQGARRYG